MDEITQKKRAGSGWLKCVLWIALLTPFLYVLSAGPAIWFVNEDIVSVDGYLSVYGTLYDLAEKYPLPGDYFDDYLDLWPQSEKIRFIHALLLHSSIQ